MPTHLALPMVSYAGLAGVTAGTLRLLSPLAWQGYALVGWTVGMPLLLILGQVAFLGGPGVAKSLGGMPSDDPRLNELAREAAAAVGVPAPQVFEVKSREPNAFAASGFTSRDTTVAVTTGLREVLTDKELGAVLAHEMGHLRHRDVVRNMHVAAAAAGFGGIYETGRMLLESGSSRKRSSKSDDKEGGGASLGLMLMGAGLATQGAAHLLRLSASRGAELKADRAAAAAYGADTLISALRKIDTHAARRPADLRQGSKGRAYAHLMISDGPATPAPAGGKKGGGGKPSTLDRLTQALRTHPPLEERVTALEKAAAAGLVPARGVAEWSDSWW